MKSKRYLKLIISLLISLALIWWLIDNIEWTTVWQELKNVNFWYLLPLTVVLLIQFILRAVRFKFLLQDSDSINHKLCFDGILLCNFVNYIMPLRAGEFARPWFLSQRSKNSFTSLFSIAVIERLFDLSSVLVIFYFSVYSLPDLPSWLANSANVLMLLAFGILTFMFLTVFARNTLRKICDFFINFTSGTINQKLHQITDDIIEASRIITSAKKLLLVITSTTLIWLITLWGYYIILQMFFPNPTLYQSAVVTAIIALAVAAPSAPGFIGVIQVGCIAAFTLLGIDKESAVAFSLVSHLHMYAITIAYGIYLIFHYGIDLIKINNTNKS